MKLGIMQPYFFPYIGYFELIARTEQWVVFDIVQYNRKSWMNRNRILHPQQGWQYVSAPVQHQPHGAPIHTICLQNKKDALEKILGQLAHYRKHAPFYEQVIDLVRNGFSRCATEKLVDLNIATLSATCDYLGLEFKKTRCSELELDLGEVEHAGQWALKIAAQLGASEYINPPGGRSIFRSDEWEKSGIRLSFTEILDFSYSCKPYKFVEKLSILDVLMWVRPENIREFLRE